MNPMQILDAISKCENLQKMETVKVYSADLVLPILEQALKDGLKVVNIGGYDFNPKSLRYQTFNTSGTTCVHCQLEGLYMAVQRDVVREKRQNDRGRYHMNLYGIKDGVAVLITKDYVIPKSKGGKNHVSNLQTMCSPCNRLKGSSMPE